MVKLVCRELWNYDDVFQDTQFCGGNPDNYF